jgi:hypothetical protein
MNKTILKNIQHTFLRAWNALVSFLKDAGEKIQNTHPTLQIVSFGVIAGIMFVLFVSVLARPDARRSVFYFTETRTGKVRTEIRYLPVARTRDERLALYSREILLGPVHQDLAPLYNPGVKLEKAFMRGRDAYIALSADALVPGPGVTESKKAYDLFKKNVCTNFRNVAKIYMYIDGIEVYSDIPAADAKTQDKKR